MSFSKRLLSRYEALSPIRFSLATATLTISLQILFILLLFGALNLFTSAGEVHNDLSVEEPANAAFNPVKFLLMSVLLAPIIETLIFQYGLIVLLRKIIRARVWLWLISTLAFGALHLRRSELFAIQAFISGSLFANAFLHWLKKTGQPWLAARVTCLSHMLHNFAYLIMNYIPASILFGFF